MKKTISGILLALAAAFALTACSKDDTTGAGTKAPAKASRSGQEINFYCWNTEFKERLEGFYSEFKEAGPKANQSTLKDGTVITWVQTANNGAGYQKILDQGLKEDDVDMYVFEADFATKYVKQLAAGYVVDMAELGVDQSRQYKYTKDIVTNADGKIVGSSWQGCPGCICYNVNVAKKVWGDEVTYDQMAGKLNTRTEFDTAAAAVKAADEGCYMLIGPDCWFRVYGNNLKNKMYDGSKITVDTALFDWINDTADYATKGYIKDPVNATLWSEDWGKSMATNDCLCVFACPWFTDFSLHDYCKTDGTYKVVKGYGSWFWGGTWLTATKVGISDATRKATITDIIKKMTTDTTTLVNIATEKLDFTNDSAAMEQLAKVTRDGKDKDGKDIVNKGWSTYFEQNTFAIYAESVKNADLSKASDFDQQINENIQSAFHKYFAGTSTATQAWDEFVAAVKTATSVSEIVKADGAKVNTESLAKK